MSGQGNGVRTRVRLLRGRRPGRAYRVSEAVPWDPQRSIAVVLAPLSGPVSTGVWLGSVGTGQYQHVGAVCVGVELAVAGVERCLQCLGECEVAGVVGGVVVAQLPDSVG